MVKRHYGIRTNRYKLIHFYNDIDEWELYDLQKDPNELHNLYGQSDYDSIVTDLKNNSWNCRRNIMILYVFLQIVIKNKNQRDYG